MVLTIPTGRRKRRRLLLLCLFALVLIVLYTLYTSSFVFPLLVRSTVLSGYKANDFSALRTSQIAPFWKQLHGKIEASNPRCERPPDVVLPAQLNVPYDPNHDHPRPDLLWIYDADLERLKTSHIQYLSSIKSSALQLPFESNTTGVVITASDNLLPILAISLHMLRWTGCQLPVEVFAESRSHFSEAFCSVILRSLNAKCVFFADIFSKARTRVKFNSYQHKALAILFSSFQNVLLLDSDAWPLKNPDFLFTSTSFVETGMIIWPDFWFAAESPFYFEIAEISTSSIPSLRSRAATESGALVYDKSRHALSIMLAAYYNFYGPTYYYVLQSQGAPGQGDKETFPNAALATHEQFHHVATTVRALGRRDSGGDFVGSAMVQWWDGELSTHIDTGDVHITTTPIATPLFVHFNAPKPDPYTIFNNPSSTQSLPPPVDSNGTNVRCWTDHANTAIDLFGFDLEQVFWNVVKDTMCGDLMGLGLWLAGRSDTMRIVGDNSESERMLRRDREACQSVKEYVREVFPV